MGAAFEVEHDLESEIDVDSEAYVDEGSGYDDEFEGLFDERDFIALGLNPRSPTGAKPGSEEKVVILAARYAAGLPLWHNEDRYDHGPERSTEASEILDLQDDEED